MASNTGVWSRDKNRNDSCLNIVMHFTTGDLGDATTALASEIWNIDLFR